MMCSVTWYCNKFATTFLSRGKTFLNLKKNGLKLESLLGNQESRNIQITDNLDDFNEFDRYINRLIKNNKKGEIKYNA